ncbi:NAD(P)/FAD-dependent oxidoreductase [Sungkyunkwania multivorans]|uniref:NAD(P)/FAD-dependent oxidoreductase n=1 Tax=Sungkyunkwania multivorans TaxID=1173618 RepID=A0ABW3D2R9_9FLAO
MNKEIIIIGGGVIGLCTAYYLQKSGHKITIIDQSQLNSGASYVNAGYLSPSHLVPLAAPGVMKKGLKWMFDAKSPLYIRPRLQNDFLRWAFAFNRSCNVSHVNKAIPIIKDITILSQYLFDDIMMVEEFEAHREKKGLLMLCQTEKMLEEEIEVAKMAKEHGLDCKTVNLQELKALEPNVIIEAIGATYYKCDWHTTPHEFMRAMKDHLKKEGVRFLLGEKVKDLSVKNGKLMALVTEKGALKADEYILSAGSWSGLLSKKLGIRLLLEAGKGYRINSKRELGITIPAILAERKVAITPMNGFTRFAGTMEIAGINHKINKVRVDSIANAVTQYYPEIEILEEEKLKAACGLRPVSPDGLPYIGRSSKCKNLIIATGHAMMGWSMATATGKLVQETVDQKKTSLDLAPFSPDRKF